MKTEEKRKLQELGGSLYLSVPSQWTGRFGLKKGSELLISMEESGEIMIFPEKEDEKTEKTAAFEYDRFFFRNLIRNYLFGTDLIRIKKSKPFTESERKEIASKVNILLNLEIIEEDSKTITIQNLKSDIPIKKMISRMHFLTKGMMEDLARGSKDEEVLKSIIDRDRLVGKLYLAVIMQQRALLTSKWSKELSFVEILDLRLLIQKIEQIGDEIKSIAAKTLRGEKKRISEDGLQFLASRYEDAFNAYIRQDAGCAKRFWDTERSDRKRLSADEDLVRVYDNIKDISDLVI